MHVSVYLSVFSFCCFCLVFAPFSVHPRCFSRHATALTPARSSLLFPSSPFFFSGGSFEGLDERAIAVFEGVGRIMSRYTSGRVPKALKLIPSLRAWEEALAAADPAGWTPHGILAATKVFVSSLNAKLAQRYVALVLLPAVRRDIQDHKRLHTALFQALKKTAGYKPAAFYKGFLLPLCASRSCTLREAVIVSSVLKRTSVPVLHSAAALLRLAELPYAGTTSFFIRVLVDKRYALPYRVVDGLVDHFSSFIVDESGSAHEKAIRDGAAIGAGPGAAGAEFARAARAAAARAGSGSGSAASPLPSMPVVWHQSLLAFVQRYKNEIRPEDLVALRKVAVKVHHPAVTPEILRELDAARARRGQGAAGAAGTAHAAHAALPAGKLPTKTDDVRNMAPIVMESDA